MPVASDDLRIPNHNIVKHALFPNTRVLCIHECVGERPCQHMLAGEMPKATTVVAGNPWSGIWGKHLVTRWCPSCVLNRSSQKHCTALQGQKKSDGGQHGKRNEEKQKYSAKNQKTRGKKKKQRSNMSDRYSLGEVWGKVRKTWSQVRFFRGLWLSSAAGLFPPLSSPVQSLSSSLLWCLSVCD